MTLEVPSLHLAEETAEAQNPRAADLLSDPESVALLRTGQGVPAAVGSLCGQLARTGPVGKPWVGPQHGLWQDNITHLCVFFHLSPTMLNFSLPGGARP